MENATLLTESELAAMAERSRLYVRRARAQGLVIPVGSTGSGIKIYNPSAIADVRGIRQNILGVSRAGAVLNEATEKVWERYKKTGAIEAPVGAKMFDGPADNPAPKSA